MKNTVMSYCPKRVRISQYVINKEYEMVCSMLF